MSAIITEAILEQSFEVIRNRIGEILATELPSQAVLNNDPDLAAAVYIERSAKIDRTDGPVVNVTFGKGSYDNQDRTSARGSYVFHIDVYSSSKSSSSDDSNKLAMVKLLRLLGVCRGILQHSKYQTLAFSAGMIGQRQVSEILVTTPVEAQDALSLVMGRLILTLKANEEEGGESPVTLADYTTVVKLGLTNNGYVFSGDGAPFPVIGTAVNVNEIFFADAQIGYPVDISVVMSNNEFIGNVNSGSGVLIPDLNHIDSNGDIVTLRPDTPMVCSPPVCNPATFKINTVTVATVAAGSEEDIPVVDSLLNPTGSFDGTYHIIPDIEFLTNGVSHTFLKAQGGQFDVVTKVGGVVEQGTYDDLTNTLDFTINPIPVRYDFIAASDIYYIGYGSASTIDSDLIDIKRVTIDTTSGSVTEAWANGTWTNHLTLIYI